MNTTITIPKQSMARMRRLYESREMGLVGLAKEYGLDPKTVRRLLVQDGVTIHGKGRPPKKEAS